MGKPEDDRVLLLKWILRQVQPRVRVGETVLSAEAIDALELSEINVARFLHVLDRGGCVDLLDLRETCISPQAQSLHVSTRSSSSRAVTPQLSQADGEVLSEQACDPPNTEVHNIAYFPILRRPLPSDVRPTHPQLGWLQGLRDRYFPDPSKLAEAVSLVAYEYLNLSQVAQMTISPKPLYDNLYSVGTTYRISTMLHQALIRINLLPLPCTNPLRRSLWEVNPRASLQLTDRDRDEAKHMLTDVMWKFKCLGDSYLNHRDALDAFGQDLQSLRLWQRATAFLVLDTLLANIHTHHSPDLSTPISRDVNGQDTFLSALQSLASTLLVSLPALSEGDDAAETWKTTHSLFSRIAGTFPEEAFADGVQWLRPPPLIACELFAVLLDCSKEDDDDDSDDDANAVSYSELDAATKPLREAWGIDGDLYMALLTAKHVEALFRPGVDITLPTCAAVAAALDHHPLPNSQRAEEWCSITAAIIGRVQHMAVLSPNTKDGVLQKMFASCGAFEAKAAQHVPVLLAGLSEVLSCGPLATSLPCPIKVPSHCDLEESTALVEQLGLHAAWHSVLGRWRRLQKVAEKDAADLEQVGNMAVPLALTRHIFADIQQHHVLTSVLASVAPRVKGAVLASYLHLLVTEVTSCVGHLEGVTTYVVDFLQAIQGLVSRVCGDGVEQTLWCVWEAMAPLKAICGDAVDIYVKNSQQSMLDFCAAAMSQDSWQPADLEGLEAFPQILDVFSCINDNIRKVSNLFLGGVDITKLVEGISLVARNFRSFLLGSEISSLNHPTSHPNKVMAVHELRSHVAEALSSRYHHTYFLPLDELCVRLNSTVTCIDEYKRSIKLLEQLWNARGKLLGEQPFRVNTCESLAALEINKHEMLRFLAFRIAYLDHQSYWNALYQIDMKHYKKYKHNKKYLSQHGPNSHLIPLGTCNIETLLDSLDSTLENRLRRVHVDVKLELVSAVYAVVVSALEWVLLGEGKDDTYFYPDQSRDIIEDLQYVEDYFSKGLDSQFIKSAMAPLKRMVQSTMSITSDELIQGGPLSRSYTQLPEADPDTPFSRKVVRQVLSRRKDPTAKKFIKKHSK